jgi:hypothetical protein
MNTRCIVSASYAYIYYIISYIGVHTLKFYKSTDSSLPPTDNGPLRALKALARAK